MFEEPVTTADLLTAWRDAIRAAELAERLAGAATEGAAQADVRAAGSAEIAASLRETGIPAAEANAAGMRRIETEAAAAYHDAGERDAR